MIWDTQAITADVRIFRAAHFDGFVYWLFTRARFSFILGLSQIRVHCTGRHFPHCTLMMFTI